MAPSHLLNRPLFEALPSWQATPLAEELQRLLAHRTNGSITQVELPLAEGRWLRVAISPALHEAPGNPSGILLALLDVTELVRLKQQLRWSEYQASIGRLARGIAHELNNPLDGVLRYTHLALGQLTEETPVREYLLHVQEGLDRMVRAVRTFLEFARQASSPVNRSADLAQLIDDALLLVRHRATFQGVRLITQLDGALPPIQDSGLHYALVNLIKNAIEAMPRGGILTIAAEPQDRRWVVLEIADTGCGMPDEVRARLFEPFFSTKPIHRGTGLGLVIAKEVVGRSGGTIDCTSQVGVGTTFRIVLPIASQEPMNGA